MIADAISRIAELSKNEAEARHKADLPRFVKTPDPRKQLLIQKDVEPEEWEKQPDPRNHWVESVDQFPTVLQAAATHWNLSDVVTWYNEDGVVAVLDDSGLRESIVRCQLRKSEEWDWIVKSGRKKSPRELVKVFRTVLCDSLDEHQLSELIATFRKITFKSGKTVKTELGHGRESMGAEILGDVSSEYNAIPEELLLKVRVFDDRALPHRALIRCAVEIDAHACEIDLLPAKADLIRAVEEVLENLHQLLTASSTRPVIFGLPAMNLPTED